MNGHVDGKKSINNSNIVIYDSKHTAISSNQSHFPPEFFKASNTNVNLDTAGGINTDMSNNSINVGTGNRTVNSYDIDLLGGSGYGGQVRVPIVPRSGDNTLAVDSIPTALSDLGVFIGTGSRTDDTYTDIPLGGSSTTGTGAKINLTVSGNNIDPTSIVVTDCGTGYTIGDVLTIPNTDIGGAKDATITLNALQNITVLKEGDGYKIGDVVTIDNALMGGNNDATITINSGLIFDGLVNRINSQMPFNVIVSSLKQNGGFLSITMPSYTKNDNKPLSFLVKYELEATEELSRYLGFNTEADRLDGYSDELFPNTGDAMNRNLIHLEGMTLDWRNESYSVSIKELPIKNYKNNDKLRNGGFSKPILANCPVPFSDSQSYSTKSKQMVTATYKPNYQVVSNLYNQQMTTNKFSVDINKLQSEKPALEIKKSIINFTILPPDWLI